MNLEVIPADTTLEAACVQAAIFRRMPASRRLGLALQLSQSLRQVVAAGVRQRHPELSEPQVRQAINRLYLGEKLSHESHLPQGVDMTQEDFLGQVAGFLEAANIPFMLAGSQSSSYHGQPRATNAVDLVIDPTAEQLTAFLDLLAGRYYVNSESAQQALRQRSMFNLIDFDNGLKADLILRKDRPFSVEEFQRRQLANLQGRQIPIASAEDVILSKLEWNKITPSERQVKDTLEVIVTQWSRLDRDYLNKWARVLGVEEALSEILRAAEGLQPPSP